MPFSNGPLSNLSRIIPVRTRRFSSYDRTGGNVDSTPIAPGETLTIAEIPGAGVIRHIWMTINSSDALIRKTVVIRCYWDGQEHPCVESPVGVFFGQGWGLSYNFVSLPLAAAPRKGGALVCYFPMPFDKSAKIELYAEPGMDRSVSVQAEVLFVPVARNGRYAAYVRCPPSG